MPALTGATERGDGRDLLFGLGRGDVVALLDPFPNQSTDQLAPVQIPVELPLLFQIPDFVVEGVEKLLGHTE